MSSKNYEYLPVFENEGSKTLVGVVDYKKVKRLLARELLARKKQAENALQKIIAIRKDMMCFAEPKQQMAKCI